VLAQYDEVIRRPHLKRPPEVVEKTLNAIRREAHWVTPTGHVRACLDADDNIFLECAEAADAHYLVTGNLRHFPAKWKRTRVTGPRQLIEILIGDNR